MKALAKWEIIINNLPEIPWTTPWAHLFAADCHRRLGDRQKAIEYYQTIADNWPDYEHAWHAQFLVGRVYEELERMGVIDRSEATAEIRAAYERVVREWPDTPAAVNAGDWLSRNRTSGKEERK